MTMRGALAAVGCAGWLVGCASTVTLRASTSDFLKPQAMSALVTSPPSQVGPVVEQLFAQRGYPLVGREVLKGEVHFLYFRGPRLPGSDGAAMNLGSYYAVRLSIVPPNLTSATVLGKPTVGGVELCSDADGMMSESGYRCDDTRVPSDWAGKSRVTGRDEAEVVAWVVTGLYERFRK